MSNRVRLFIETSLCKDGIIPLNDKQMHYITKVMRLGLGDKLVVFNGKDGEWHAEITNISKRLCNIKIIRFVRKSENESDISLVFSLLKRGATDLLVEKATELGVSRLCPMISKRTNTFKVNANRLKAICIEASEQCGRVTVPIIEQPKTLGNILAEWPRQKGLLFLDESGSGKPILEVLRKKTSWQAHAILVGPEGGFTPAERDKMLQNSFIRPATLGERLVRAETAAISALSIYNANMAIDHYKN